MARTDWTSGIVRPRIKVDGVEYETRGNLDFASTGGAAITPSDSANTDTLTLTLSAGAAGKVLDRSDTEFTIRPKLRVIGGKLGDYSGDEVTEIDLGRVDVREFGADPTGLTDSSSAFTDAIAAAAAEGGAVFVPNGTYKITNVALVSDTKIFCESRLSQLKGNATGDTLLLAGAGVNRVEIYGGTWKLCTRVLHLSELQTEFKFVGMYIVGGLDAAFYMRGGGGHTWRDCNFDGGAGGLLNDAIVWYGNSATTDFASTHRYTDCRFVNLDGIGIHMENGQGEKNGHYVRGCWFEKIDEQAILIGGGSRKIVIESSYFANCGGTSFCDVEINRTSGSGVATIRGVTIADCYFGQGTFATPAARIKIVGNAAAKISHNHFLLKTSMTQVAVSIDHTGLTSVPVNLVENTVQDSTGSARAYDACLVSIIAGTPLLEVSREPGSQVTSGSLYPLRNWLGRVVLKPYTLSVASNAASVEQGDRALLASAASLKTLTDGVDGQVLTITAKGSATVQDQSTASGNIALVGARDYLMIAGDTLTLAYQDLGSGAAWREIGRRQSISTVEVRGTDLTNASSSISWSQGSRRVLPAATLSTGRTLTLLNSGGVKKGDTIRVIRLDTTANTYTINNHDATPLLVMPVSVQSFAVLEYDGTNWVPIAMGSM